MAAGQAGRFPSAPASAPGTTARPPGCRFARPARWMPRNCPPMNARHALEPTPWLKSADPRWRAARCASAGKPRSRDEDGAAHRLRPRPHVGGADRHARLRHGARGLAVPARRLHRVSPCCSPPGTRGRCADARRHRLVYARHFEGHRHVFVPHAWVQAWTGTGWESFDAAIGSFDSTHLAFAVSYDGNPANHYAGIELVARVDADAGGARGAAQSSRELTSGRRLPWWAAPAAHPCRRPPIRPGRLSRRHRR